MFIAFFLVLLALLLLLWPRIVISILPGQNGVLYRMFLGGVVTERAYPPGLHILQPWNSMYIYNTRLQVTQHSFAVLSERGLPVKINMAIRYRPIKAELGTLHQEIGPDYAQRVLIPEVEAVLRRDLSQLTAVEIYTNAGAAMAEALLEAQDQARQDHIEVEDVVIRSVVLPDRVREAIESKLVQREILASYDFQLETATAEAQRLRIEAEGIRDYNNAIDPTLTEEMLRYETLRLARSLSTAKNTRAVILGGADGVPFTNSDEEPSVSGAWE